MVQSYFLGCTKNSIIVGSEKFSLKFLALKKIEPSSIRKKNFRVFHFRFLMLLENRYELGAYVGVATLS